MLSFLAGSVNVGGYMACHRFVSHVTGFATLFGADIAGRHWLEAWSMLTVPMFFIVGGMLSALLIEKRIFEGKRPLYALAMGMVSLCLFLVILGGGLHFFGEFGDSIEIHRDFWLLVLLCLASGIQNAVVTRASGTVVRTTHLTGISTDLAVGIVKVMFPYQRKEELVVEKRNNLLRMGIIFSFIVGSAAGAIAYAHWEFFGFLLPFVLALFATMIAKIFWEKTDYKI
jgi:uncharacterized membrane protein YoaK (UPF0700 family)